MSWRPISTAPKDGTRILGYAPHWQSEQRIQWEEWGVDGNDDESTAWWEYCETLLADIAGEADPTHWMPLPEPPEPGQ